MGMLIQLAILELIFRKITVLQSSLIDESSFIQLMLLAGLKGKIECLCGRDRLTSSSVVNQGRRNECYHDIWTPEANA